MRTTGLGGDSEVQLIADGLNAGLRLGPKRRVPLALVAMDWPKLVHAALDAQLASERSGEMDGQFVVPILRKGRNLSGLSDRERGLVDRLGETAMAKGDLIRARVDVTALERLVARGLVQIAGFTPSDASHVLGRQQGWDRAAAEKGARLFARQKTATGDAFAANARSVCQAVIARLVRQTSEILLETAFAEDGFEHPERLARHVLAEAGMQQHIGAARISVGLGLPLIGLGASAPTYYGAVAEGLGCAAILPEHAGVANAIGAVVGQVRVTARVLITAPAEGRFRVHLPTGPADFTTLPEALALAETAAAEQARAAALTAGAAEVGVAVDRAVQQADVDGRAMFLAGEVVAVASGRPAIAG